MTSAVDSNNNNVVNGKVLQGDPVTDVDTSALTRPRSSSYGRNGLHGFTNHTFIPETANISRRASALSLSVASKRSSTSTLQRSKPLRMVSEKEKKVMAGFSSVNYSPTHSLTYMDWLKKHPPIKYQWDRWLLLTTVAIAIGIIAWLQKQFLELLDNWKWQKGKEYTHENRLLEAWGWVLGLATAYIICGSWLVVFVHPPACGSGVPEVISFLNGVVVHGTLTLKNLLVKFFANVLAVSSGLPSAIQGPMIAMGAVVGVGIGQFKSRTLNFSPNLFSRFRNAEDRRSFTTAGVAAGVAAAFNAPIGGLLFAMEDLSSFWSRRISWQTFFCAGVAAITADLMNTGFTAFSYQGSFGLLSVALTEPLRLHIAVLLPAIVLGVIGGVLGALFVSLNAWVVKQRKKLLSYVDNRIGAGLLRMLETLIMVLVMVTTTVYLPDAFPCAEQSLYLNESRTLQTCYAIVRNTTSVSLEQYNCLWNSTRPDNNTVVYSEVATLMQGSGTKFLDQLMARGTHRWFGYGPLLAILPIWYIMIVWSCGSAIAGGIFVPNMITGALYGRVLGLCMIDIYQAVTGESVPIGTDWDWMDPGLIATIGAGSMLGGATRLCLAVTVITVEMSQDLDLTVSILVAIFVAKVIADIASHPLYYYQLRGKMLPYLVPEPEVRIGKHLVNMELCKAKDVMSQPVQVLHAAESVATLAKILTDTEHGGFPVVKYDEETRLELAYGLITRTELYVILCCKEVYDENKPGAIVKPTIDYQDLSVDFIPDPSFSEERVRHYTRFPIFHKIFVDLEPFINISASKIDEDYSLQRTLTAFRTMGLRHLVVTDIRNRVTGIITRKDLVGFHIEEKLLELGEVRTEALGCGDDSNSIDSSSSELSTVSRRVQGAEKAQTTL